MSNDFGMILDDVPAYAGGTSADCFDCNNGSYLIRITETSKEEYEKYIEYLQSTGFELLHKNAIKDNYFATYAGKNKLFHVYHSSHEGITRIVIDQHTTSLYQRQEVDYDIVCDTTIYQLELDYRNIDCGMCYVTQCADGSFFIVDSAHMNSINDHHRIHDLLRKLTAVDKKIVIAGWFFTHAHQDHIAKFMDFLTEGYDDVILEGLYYNFPSLTVQGSEAWSESDKQTMREFDALISQHDTIPLYKLHTGQKFNIRNLEFEVLATHEDMYPRSLAYYNDSSAILQMTVEGSKVMFLGDSNYTECGILIDRYGDYLKSDIVQVAHHGYNKDNVQIYHYVNAGVALYATRQSRYEDSKQSDSNRAVTDISEEIYIAGNGMVALKLPYKEGTATVFTKEIND